MPSDDRVSQVVHHLEDAIMTGRLKAGDPLPPERELSAELHVSRSVVREALGQLASMGLVRRQQGSGTRVCRPTSGPMTAGFWKLLQAQGLRETDLLAVRVLLEPAIARHAALQRTDQHLSQLELQQSILADESRTFETHLKADVEFHLILARATGNPVFEMVIGPIQQLLIESRRRSLSSIGTKAAMEQHARIIDAVRRQDPEAADREMRLHLPRFSDGDRRPPTDDLQAKGAATFAQREMAD